MSAALQAASPQGDALDGAKARAFIEGLSTRVDRLGELVEVAGSITHAVEAVFEATDNIHDVAVAAEQMIRVNEAISSTAKAAQVSATAVREGLNGATTSIRDGLDGARRGIETLAAGASLFSGILGDATATVQKVSSSSDAITAIAREIQLIAINAGVEAARSGVAGRGFAVIANAIKDLAEQTRAATAESARQLSSLSKAIEKLDNQSRTNEAEAHSASAESARISERLAAFDAFGRTVHVLVADIESIAGPVADNIRVCNGGLDQLEAVDDRVDRSRVGFAEATQRINALVQTTQDLVGYIAESTIEAKDGQLIASCQDAAKRISALFEAAVVAGDISLDDLFDDSYQPVPGSNPEQVMTRFVRLTDRLLPAIQEPILGIDPRIVFCAAVDRNGYLPTHNKIYSQPQRAGDPTWNAAHCRNRRIFADRTGLSAGRNLKRFLVQTYRRDMGGGQFALMKDISAPIHVRGRHWGGFRIGVKA
jgi:methyl-accepting chemotaxis protein